MGPVVEARRAARPEMTLQQEVLRFLEEKEGSVLRAWLKFFDTEMDLRVTALVFGHGLREMGFTGDISATFAELDVDKSGDLPLEELDKDLAWTWQTFREWAADTFEGSKDMFAKLSGIGAIEVGPDRLMSQGQWLEGLRQHGWDQGGEMTIFSGLDIHARGAIDVSQLKWFDVERKRRRRKEQAKQRAMKERPRMQGRNRSVYRAAVGRFKRFLKRTYGSYIRAWRFALSPHDQMVIQRTPFYKACADLGFSSEVKLIWHGFGKNECGRLLLDEFDPMSAVILASFKALVDREGGAANAFRTFDRADVKKVKEPDFLSTLDMLGYNEDAKVLFQGLDKDQKGYIVQEDMYFLDRWHPPEFLTVQPNPSAKEEFKQGLINKWKYYLKAWRRALDPEGRNRCDWEIFLLA